MLRIDENSKTLVAPQAAEVVQDVPPAPEELLEMACASWDAFMSELGLSSLRLVATAPLPGVDALAFDESSGRVAVVQFTGGENQLAAALEGAAMVASLDADALEDIHVALSAVVPGDSPQIVLIGSGLDQRQFQLTDFLVRRHGVDVTAYALVVFRYGADKLLSVRRDYPAAEGAPNPEDEIKRMLSEAGHAVASAAGNGASTPPPAAS